LIAEAEKAIPNDYDDDEREEIMINIETGKRAAELMRSQEY